MAENVRTPVRVVTVYYNSGRALPRFLETINAATTRPLEIVVVDNASPTTPSVAEGVRVVRSDANLGYGGGVNLGAADSESEWLLVANPDLVWEPDSLDTLIDHAERWPKGGVFGPMLLEPDGSPYPSARRFPTVITGVGHALLSRIWPSNPWSRRYRNEGTDPLADRQTDWLSGACLLIRRSAFDEVGGFDESYFMFFEDVDLCWRLAELGYTSHFVPQSQVRHDQGHSWRSQPAEMIRAHHASAYRYVSRRYDGLRYAPLRFAVRIGLEARLRFQLFASGRAMTARSRNQDR